MLFIKECYKKQLVCFIFCLLVCCSCNINKSYSEAKTNTNTSYIWLNQDEPQYEKNGAVTQRVYLNLAGSLPPIGSLQNTLAICTMQTRSREATTYKIPIKQKDDRYYLEIKAEERCRAKLFFTGETDEVVYTAQTMFNLYPSTFAKTGKLDLAVFEEQWKTPFIDIERVKRVQTGEKTIFKYKADHQSIARATLIEQGANKLEPLTIDAAGMLEYIPKHDASLDKKGNSAYKNMTIYIENNGDKLYKNTFTFKLYRGYNARRYSSYAIALFAFVTIISVGFIMYRRRRFPLK